MNRKDEFIKKSTLKHKNKYNYSQVDYKDSVTKVIILCEIHGSFLQEPASHTRGTGCPKCSGKYSYTTKEYIDKVKVIHGNFYDYTKTEYINSTSKLLITCPIHGDFEQNPSDHQNGSGCKKCYIEQIRSSTEQFIEKAKKIYGEKHDYDLVDYIDRNTYVKIICPKHGIFEKSPLVYLKGQGCQKCARETSRLALLSTNDHFISKSILVHSDKYDYSLVDYKGSAFNVIIICKQHGEFEQRPDVHIRGGGCTRCSKESHWRRSDYVRKANGRKCIFYIIRCFNDQEEFYKIGITMGTIKKRYKSKVDMPYNYEIISCIYGEADSIWNMERDEKRKLKNFQYKPKINFCGSKTECFTQFKITLDEQ